MKIKKGSVVTFIYQEDKKSPKYNGIGAYDNETKSSISFICYMLYGEGLEGIISPDPATFRIKHISNIELETPEIRIRFQESFYNLGYAYDSFNAKLYSLG